MRAMAKALIQGAKDKPKIMGLATSITSNPKSWGIGGDHKI